MRGGSPDLERGELTIFEKESSYFKVATLDTAELGSFPSPDRLRCPPLWGAGTGTVPELLPGHRMRVTHRGGGRGGSHTPLALPQHNSRMPPGRGPASGCLERSSITQFRCAGRPPWLPSNSHLPWGPQVSSSPHPQWCGGLLGLGSANSSRVDCCHFGGSLQLSRDTNKTGFHEHSSNSY